MLPTTIITFGAVVSIAVGILTAVKLVFEIVKLAEELYRKLLPKREPDSQPEEDAGNDESPRPQL